MLPYNFPYVLHIDPDWELPNIGLSVINFTGISVNPKTPKKLYLRVTGAVVMF